jgi:hypothetical protein
MAKHQQKRHQRNKRHAKRILPVDPQEFYTAVLQTVEGTKNPHIQGQKAQHILPVTDSKQFVMAFTDWYPKLWDNVSAFARLEALLRVVEEHDLAVQEGT